MRIPHLAGGELPILTVRVVRDASSPKLCQVTETCC